MSGDPVVEMGAVVIPPTRGLSAPTSRLDGPQVEEEDDEEEEVVEEFILTTDAEAFPPSEQTEEEERRERMERVSKETGENGEGK